MKLRLELLLFCLSPVFSFAQTFQDLHIDKNRDKIFTDIDKALLQRDRVYHLDLSNKKLSEVPQAVIEFPNLISLDLSNNNLASLDQIDWSLFRFLEAINLHNNKLSVFPEMLLDCPNITQLNIGSNRIVTIPESLVQWDFLSVLKAHHNHITTLPDNWPFRHLREIRLDGNQIKSLPENFFSDKPRLTSVNLNGNMLTRLPSSIRESKISRLDIGANEVENPAILKAVTTLEYLILDGTTLDNKSLIALSHLNRLETLSIEHCGIISLPDEVTDWKKLRELSLMHNELNQIPQDLLILPRLEKLWVQFNPIDVESLIVPESVTVYY